MWDTCSITREHDVVLHQRLCWPGCVQLDTIALNFILRKIELPKLFNLFNDYSDELMLVLFASSERTSVLRVASVTKTMSELTGVPRCKQRYEFPICGRLNELDIVSKFLLLDGLQKSNARVRHAYHSFIRYATVFALI
jgi:hypothetical protein